MKTKTVLLFIPVFLSIILFSCGPTSENAKKYDAKLVNELAKVYTKEALLIAALSKKAPETLDALHKDLEMQLDSSMTAVKNMDSFDGKTDLRDAAIRVIEAYNTYINTDYKELIKLAKIPDTLYLPKDDDKKLELSNRIDKSINKVNNEFLDLEKGFIEKYKVQLLSDEKAGEKEKK